MFNANLVENLSSFYNKRFIVPSAYGDRFSFSFDKNRDGVLGSINESNYSIQDDLNSGIEKFMLFKNNVKEKN